MSERNEFSAGLGAKVCGAVADEGGTPAELNGFSENPTLVRQLLAVIRGTAKFVVTEVEKIPQLVKSDIAVSVLMKPFVVKDHFVVDTSVGAKVKIAYLGGNFQSQFLNQTLQPRGGFKSSSSKFTKSSLDKPVLAELGERHETDLGMVFDLMARQPNGEKKGVLLTNGLANIFYCKDTTGVLRAVSVRWRGDGWYVYSCSVEYPFEWREGRQVFSRNSVTQTP